MVKHLFDAIGESTSEVSIDTPKSKQPYPAVLRNSRHGLPRPFNVIDARALGSSAPMQVVKAAIFDAVTGGELRPTQEDELDATQEALAAYVIDRLHGPHKNDLSWDDVLVTAINDMIDIGQSYTEILGNDHAPFVSFLPVDAATVKHNLDQHGVFQEPAYYQHPMSMGSAWASSGDQVPLEEADVFTMRFPKSTRSSSPYPLPPVEQTEDFFEILENATEHLRREYSDNEMGAGFLHAEGGDPGKIVEEFKRHAGDPNAFPVVTGSGQLEWKETTGNALSLDPLREQEWFLQLACATLGVSKQEVGLTDSVNKSTADQQAEQMFKRITRPLVTTIEDAINTQLLPRFDVYDGSWTIQLFRSDPGQERREEERSGALFEAGAITLNEHRAELGMEPLEILVQDEQGNEFNVGDLPRDQGRYLFQSMNLEDLT